MFDESSMELAAKLESLGLSQYATILLENGFEDWDTVLDITEDDLDSLGFKRGHRRVLQKEIAISRGSTSSPREDGPKSPLGPVPGRNALAALDNFEKKTKRRYRWHPRPDPNAPKKPKTAYVNFADHLRSDPSIASLSFVDIAREVGKRWQTMDQSVKQDWENQAAQAMQAYEDQMDVYRTTKLFQDYQDYLETFKKAPGKSARQKIKSSTSPSVITSPRRSESSGPDRSPSRSADSPSPSSTEESMREECRHALGTAVLELSRFHRDQLEDEPFTSKNLPSETLSRRAITALMDGGGAIFHITNVAETEDLITRVYHSSNLPDALALTELCIIAAVGGQFTREAMPAHHQRRLFVTVCTLLEGLVLNENDYLRLMRIFLCLTMYSIVEKYLSVRSFITAGLAIAKFKYSSMVRDGGSREDWTKVYRTLLFTECWLSQTLGFAVQNLDVHVRNAVEPILSETSVENAIQWQAVRIAIIGSEISTATRQPETISPDAVQYLASQLDLWQRELPRELQLGTLLSAQGSNIGPHSERAMLIVHTFYLGSVILLYGQPLVAAENGQGYRDNPDLSLYRSTCLTAGEQIARLLTAVTANLAGAPRFWLIIYWAFSACNMLLYGAASALRARSTNDHDRLLASARTCLLTLENCAADEPVASRYLDTITPIYEALRRLRESPHQDLVRRKSEHKISINDLLARDDAGPSKAKWEHVDGELPGVIRMVTSLLRDPFGRLQGDGRDPYPTPPSCSDVMFWFR